VGPATTGGADEARVNQLPDRVIWVFVALGIALSLATAVLPSDATRSFVDDAIAIVAAGGALYGILRNEPGRRGVWQLFIVALVLYAAGDVTFDVAVRWFGRPDGYPFADVLYIVAYVLLAVALVRLARSRYDRSTLIDSAIVAVTLSAVIWQWVITPVLERSTGPALDRMVTVAYPLLDILLVVVILHAVLTLPRWTAAAWLLFGGLAAMMLADALYARLVAEGTYADGMITDALWPISYVLLAAAVMHPSMRALWQTGDVGIVRHGRARMVVLGVALFAVPSVVIIDGQRSTPAIILAAITGIAALAVAWRITGIVDESNTARVVLAASEERFRALVQHAVDVIVVVDRQGTIKYLSPSAATTLGLDPAVVTGVGFARFLDEAGVASANRVRRELLENPGTAFTSEFRLDDGTQSHWVEATLTNKLDEPAVQGIVGNLREITERKRANAFADAEAKTLEHILSGAPVPETLTLVIEALEAYIPDGAGSIRLHDAALHTLECVAAPNLPPDYVDQVSASTTTDDVERYLDTNEPRIVRDISLEIPDPEFARRCADHGLRGVATLPIRSPDGAEFLGELGFYLRSVRDLEHTEMRALVRGRDLAAIAIDRDARTRELGHLALHDTLTGLPNRALAYDRLEHALARLDERDDAARVAVLFVDLDRFKHVNDGLGHDIGDELLVAVSRRLSASVRQHDTIARLGGDEFVVLCEDLVDERHAVDLAERAAAALAEPFSLSRAEVTISASIGIAVTGRSSERAATLLQDADAAMYRAKRRGGARHELFDEAMRTQAVSRLLTERALRRALDHDELRVLFQPQVDLASGARVAIEALLRWDHPVRGLVTAAEFVMVAEETGVIVPMGEWVLETACLAARSTGPGPDGAPLTVAANVSRRQLQGADFPAFVARTVRDLGIDPTTLCLEVAESALLDDFDTVADAVRALKDIGVQLAIDDFGTGGSSLTYLRRFAFDQLKIDRMFVEGLGRSAADDAIVAATIDMAHALNMVVVAEGVETEAQRVGLRELGCDRAQGYHLGAPEALTTPRLVLVSQRPA
jgi:diguanylate cyclase (GGDEF)-like protein/PAS domain S-box-containing protein